MSIRGREIGLLQTALLLLLPGICAALPFNDDMVHDQLKRNEVMRPLPAGAVPLSASTITAKNLVEARELQNPAQDEPHSIQRGKILWATNCSPCHGVYEGGQHTPGVVGPLLAAPNVADAGYHDRTDGHLWGYIHFGGALMPRYGWKLSDQEHWDLVNYVRNIQGKGR